MVTAGRRPRTALLLPLTVAVGGGLAVQARINGALAVRLDSPLTAGAVNFLVGLTVVTAAVAVRGIPFGRLRTATGARWWYWIGGLCAAVYVYSVVAATPRIGVSILGVGIAAGMAVASLFADAIGLAAAGRHPLVTRRVAGAVLAVVAVVVSSSGTWSGNGELAYVALAVAGGLAIGVQQPINSRLGAALGDAGLAAVVSFLVGSLAIGVLAAGDLPSRPWPGGPGLYTGGLIAAAYVLVAIPAVGHLGALRVSLATMSGQLVTAAVLDVVAPVAGRHLTALKLAGVAMAIAAVVLVGSKPSDP